MNFTRRQLFRLVAGLFDRPGLASPLAIEAKATLELRATRKYVAWYLLIDHLLYEIEIIIWWNWALYPPKSTTEWLLKRELQIFIFFLLDSQYRRKRLHPSLPASYWFHSSFSLSHLLISLPVKRVHGLIAILLPNMTKGWTSSEHSTIEINCISTRLNQRKGTQSNYIITYTIAL